MTKEDLIERLKDFTYWYHKIELAPGVITPGFDLDDLWKNLRKVREHIDYKDKNVLDIASFDGMYAFEAEKLGASNVIASDCQYKSFNNFLFCREVLNSSVTPYYNISPYNLVDRLDVYMDENYKGETPDQKKFDIVQHLGLLYHLRDPMYSISQARSVLKTGGKLIIETALLLDTDESFMLFNGLPNSYRVHDNYSVWWAPTRECLFEILEATMFEVQRETYSEIYFDVPANDASKLSEDNVKPAMNKTSYRIGRGAVVAVAVDRGQKNEKFETELLRTYRNPGIDLHRLNWK
jgi:tRNA (mo5U34)-methyltransferase